MRTIFKNIGPLLDLFIYLLRKMSRIDHRLKKLKLSNTFLNKASQYFLETAFFSIVTELYQSCANRKVVALELH